MFTKITIGVPTNRGLEADTLKSVLELIARGNYDFHIVVAEEGYTIAENRNYIAVKALNNGSDYLLMIDDDMTFEPELLDKLLEADKDIVGVAYHPRADTGQIIKYMDEVTAVAIEHSTDPKYKSIFECHATGTGIILIKCDVFRKVPRPWFMFEYHETGQCKLGEDWYFCREAKKQGFKIWTHPNIKVGHIGEYIF